MPSRRLLIGAGMQLVLLGGLMIATALMLMRMLPLGWHGFAIALTLYALIALLVVRGLGQHAPHRRFGLANGVTLTRAALTALLAGVLGETVLGETGLADPTLRWALALGATAALVLDGVDGWAARRHGLASRFGARFDMETDALFLLALTLLVHEAGRAGAWVLTTGLLRYIFVAGGWLWPPLARELPPSRRRKIACVVQAGVLIVALLPPVPPALASLMCLGGLALLIYSFAVDCLWLMRVGKKSGAAAVASWAP